MSAQREPASERQVRFIGKLAKDAGLTLAERNELIRRVTNFRADEPLGLSKGDASLVIARLIRGVDLVFPVGPGR